MAPSRARRLELGLSGKVHVYTGAGSQGQGQDTALAQICADVLDVPHRDVGGPPRRHGRIPYGTGTYATRTTVLAGNAVAASGGALRAKLVRAGARLLEAAEADLEVEDGRVFVRGSPGRALTFASIVRGSLPSFQAPGAVEPDFEATTYQGVPTVTYASAVHVAVVEVDPETGRTRLLRYVVAHDCGRVINPMLVDGQIHGGVAQGVGGGLGEEIFYDPTGQLLTGSLMDYAVPRADELPFIETVHLERPSPRNLLEVKGVGEGAPSRRRPRSPTPSRTPWRRSACASPRGRSRRPASPRRSSPRSGLDAQEARLASEPEIDVEAQGAGRPVVPEEIGVEAGRVGREAHCRAGRTLPGRGRRRSPAIPPPDGNGGSSSPHRPPP